jgi:hypothetical protein
MNLKLLKFLTWSTVAGAIGSALALASVEAGLPQPMSVASGRHKPLQNQTPHSEVAEASPSVTEGVVDETRLPGSNEH